MKRLNLLLALGLAICMTLVNLSCGGGPKPIDDEVSGIDTTTAIPEELITEEEPEAPRVRPVSNKPFRYISSTARPSSFGSTKYSISAFDSSPSLTRLSNAANSSAVVTF